MQNDDVDLPQVTPLVIGLTQNPTMLGVPYMAMVIVGAITFIAWLASDSFWALAIGPVAYLILLTGCSVDPKILDVMRISMSKTPRTRNKVFWGSNSYGP